MLTTGRWRGLKASVAAALVAATTLFVGQSPAHSHGLLPTFAQALVPPAGFGQTAFTELPPGDLATSLTFGPDGRLYVAAVQGFAVADGAQALGAGRVYAVDDLGGIGGAPEVVASGFNQLLGITFGPDGTMYLTDNVNNRGTVFALRDADGDGSYEQRRVVLTNIPNGRHQTNGMSFGPDGMLYVTNGSATDDGIECGPEPASPLECPTPEVEPWTGSILRVNPAWTDLDLMTGVIVDTNAVDDPDVIDDEQVLAAQGFRNIYDVDFDPSNPSMVYTPMNGSDNPATNEPLYRTDVLDSRVVGTSETGQPIFGPVIDDAGYPSCLYGPHENIFPTPDVGGHPHPDSFEPEESTDPAVIDRYGPCSKSTVLRPIMFFADAHNGVSGLAFERGDNFPDRYDGSLFVAEWGSMWNLNAAEATGHKITQIDFDENGDVKRRRAFASGGAPMDLTFGPDGGMYVADFHGSIYRIASVQDTPDSYTIEITNGQFIPQVLVVPHDSTVIWANTDTVPHNVIADRALRIEDPSEAPVVQPGNEINSSGDIPSRGWHSYTFGDGDGIWIYHSAVGALDSASYGVIIVAPVER